MQYLKATAARAQDGELDAKALDLAISRTERGVQAAAEKVLASSQNKVTEVHFILLVGYYFNVNKPIMSLQATL